MTAPYAFDLIKYKVHIGRSQVLNVHKKVFFGCHDVFSGRFIPAK